MSWSGAWRAWRVLSAALALVFGLVTVAAFTLAGPGWERLELAVLLGTGWLLLGLLWLAVLLFRLASRNQTPVRSWIATPLIVAVAFVATVAGVAASPHLRETTARMEVNLEIEGTTALVTGTTDLPDGSVLWLGAQHGDAAGIATGRDARVREGRFSAALDLTRWPRGRIEASATFQMHGGQPAEAIERFGVEGDGLWGPDTFSDSDGRYLAVWEESELLDGLPADHPDAYREPGTVLASLPIQPESGSTRPGAAASPPRGRARRWTTRSARRGA